MRLPKVSLAFGMAVVLSLALSARAAQAGSDGQAQVTAIRVEPKEIRVGMFYRGANVHVAGTAPAGSKLSVVCVGPEGKVELKKKGKVWGTLWMNVGDVTFDRVPSLYLVRTELDGARPDERSVEPDARLGLGYAGIEAQVVSAREDENMHRLFREFVRLKEHERLYSAGELIAQSVPGGSGVTFSADFALPASVPPGSYEVRLYGYRGAKGEMLASGNLAVRRVGFAELIASMAQRYGLLYGILSVVVAIGAGFLTGVLFSKASKAH